MLLDKIWSRSNGSRGVGSPVQSIEPYPPLLESLRAGVRLRRRDVSAAEATIRYFSVDVDPALCLDLVADLSEVSLAEVVSAALSHHGA